MARRGAFAPSMCALADDARLPIATGAPDVCKPRPRRLCDAVVFAYSWDINRLVGFLESAVSRLIRLVFKKPVLKSLFLMSLMLSLSFLGGFQTGINYYSPGQVFPRLAIH